MKTLVLFLTLVQAYAGSDPAFPNTDYDPNIPTLEQVVGFDFGRGITLVHEAMNYSKELAKASDKVHYLEHGRSYEGRPLAKLFISSAANIAKMESFKKSYQAIADPRKTSEEQLTSLVADLPVLVLLQESVHGNEISGTDSGLLLAYHLAAAKNNAEIDKILDQTMVMIEITQNPDGRDRFVNFSRQTRALHNGDADPQAAERAQPWATGRANHYLFDMNRDWFAMTQQETKAKIKMFLEWFPQVSVDLHEMGSESTFFAANPSPPSNPMLSEGMRTAYVDLGKAIANQFDMRNIDYFHSEIFDSFYPGYGEIWPSLHGTVGVLFEQASARGLVYRRKDGTLLHHRDAVGNQTIASYGVVLHAANNREKYLRFFYQTRKEPMEDYQQDRQIFLFPGKDPHRMMALGELLQNQGIEVEQLQEPIKNLSAKKGLKGDVSKYTIPKGSLMVRFDQPAGRLARTLLIDHMEMDPSFAEAERKRHQSREFSQIYDITGWSLPYDFGVDAVIASGSGWRGSGSQELSWDATITNPDATVAFFIPYTAQTGKIIADLLADGITPKFATQTIRFGDHSFPPGSLIIKRSDYEKVLPEKLNKISKTYGVSITGTSQSWFDSGPSLGSGRVHTIRPFRAAMLWDEPNSTLSAGWLRFTMEQDIGFPITALKTGRIGRYDLSPYKVIFMPSASSGGLNHVLGSGGAGKIKDWVRKGGVLVALDRSVDWLMRENVGLLNTARELSGGELSGGKSPDSPPKKPEENPKDMLLPQQEYPKSIPGALLRVNFDTKHWLAYGMSEQQAVMVNSNRIYRPIRLDAGANVGMFADKDTIWMSGFTHKPTLDQMAHKPYAMVVRQGRGIVIAMTEDPNFRGFMKGLQPLVVNALFFAPTQTY